MIYLIILNPHVSYETNETTVEQARYQLPLRATRGIPPKRYDPEYEVQRSKYPITRQIHENMSETTLAFNDSLYSTEIPKIVEEALKNEQ